VIVIHSQRKTVLNHLCTKYHTTVAYTGLFLLKAVHGDGNILEVKKREMCSTYKHKLRCGCVTIVTVEILHVSLILSVPL
jgi:hypothetical protein